MTDRERGGGSVRPPVALAFATVSFVALLIFGLGMTTLLLEEDIVATPGFGQMPGVIATVCAVGAFALGLWIAIRPPRARTRGTDATTTPVPQAAQAPTGEGTRAARPSFWNALWIVAATLLAYLVGLWWGAVLTGADLGVASGVAGRIGSSWFALVIAGAALVAAWGGIALVRTRAGRPRWPWEKDDDE